MATTRRLAIGFEQLTPLLGKRADDPMVLAVLAAAGGKASPTTAGGKVSPPDANEQYLTCKAAGFELLLRSQRVHTLFLYPEGVRGSRGFPLPFGIDGPRKALLARLGPPTAAWAMGSGPIPPLTSRRADLFWAGGASNRDLWHLDGFQVVVMSGPPAGDRARNPQQRALVIAVEVSPIGR